MFRDEWEAAYKIIEHLAVSQVEDADSLTQAVAHIEAAEDTMPSVDGSELDDLRERDSAMVHDFFESLSGDQQRTLMHAGFEVVFGNTRLPQDRPR
jgi:hypothetical protein